MLICFMCDLHLPYNKNAVQYDVLDWACSDIVKKNADAVVFAGDFTADGNVFATKRFVRKMHSLGRPYVMIPGNSDCRTQKNIPFIKQFTSPLVTKIGEYTFIAVDDSERIINDDAFASLENADEKTFVIMHHPVASLAHDSATRFEKWRREHLNVKVFYGHLHVSEMNGNDISLQAADPDKAIGENPCITYYNTETGEFRKAYYFCPVPNDFYRFIGITCFNPVKDIAYATEHGIRNLELRYNTVGSDREELLLYIAKWRSLGTTNLSLHAPEIYYSNGMVTNTEQWDDFISFASGVVCDRITLHVPNISVDTVKKDRNALDNIADFLAKRFAMLPEKCVIGVENMHMTSKDSADDTRRFGYIPEECVEFMKHLSGKCTRKSGINLDIGHARNNVPYSQKYTLGTWYTELGRFTVGYHLHQVVKGSAGFENHMPFTEIYGELISLASFFDAWNKGVINKAPVIFEIRGKDGEYKQTIELFEKYRARNVFDLHSHTLFSDCGRDKPEKVISTAINNGIKILGITDHNYGIGDKKQLYLKKIRELAPKYADKIKLLCGIEIATLPEYFDINNPEEIHGYDYCLIEHITAENSIAGKDFIGFCEKFHLKCGIAHTDMFEYCAKMGYEPLEYFKELAAHDTFWEMNVSYDSIHGYREHEYVKEFMRNEEQQRIVRESGLHISIGFDSHRCEDYDGYKVHEMYDFLKEKGIKTADMLFTD